jgi:hypothetical protein
MADLDFEISATPITIGRRSLTVRECTFWDVAHKIGPFQKKAKEEGLSHDDIFGMFLYFVGHNEGVDREWLEKHMPANLRRTMDLLLSVFESSGLERGKPGEAPAR